jgi:peptide chain release factor 3
MVIDAAKGIEAQTKKLFEVCRMRDVPIVTFINKMDREGRDPFELLDEIEHKLALDVTPATWPIGMGQGFLGCYDLRGDQLHLMERSKGEYIQEAIVCEGLGDPQLDKLLPEHAVGKLRGDVEMVRGLCKPLDLQSYREGHMTPVFFGSAVNNFGVRELLAGIAELAPPPRPQPAVERAVDPGEPKVSGFVFKIQANMDPKHRDRIAFVRLASGHFARGMKLVNPRTEKTLAVGNAMLFQANARELAEEAWAGDIIGLPNHGGLRIGDALTEGEVLRFTGIPSFAPELLQPRATGRPDEGQASRPRARAARRGGRRAGVQDDDRLRLDRRRRRRLQFDVLADRIRTEYDLPVIFEGTSFERARWVEADDPKLVKKFADGNRDNTAEDHSGATVFLARNDWQLNRVKIDWPDIRLLSTREQQR